MRRTSRQREVVTVRYLCPSHRQIEDRRDHQEEITVLKRVLAPGRGVLKTGGFSGLAEFLQVLSTQPCDIVVIASDHPCLGLFESVGEDTRARAAVDFAEQLPVSCMSNTGFMLMASNSSWLAPELANHGHWGVSFDSASSVSMLGFLRGFLSCINHGRSCDVSYRIGCLAMAYADPSMPASARLFGPGLLLERGHHQECFVEPWTPAPGQTRGSRT